MRSSAPFVALAFVVIAAVAVVAACNSGSGGATCSCPAGQRCGALGACVLADGGSPDAGTPLTCDTPVGTSVAPAGQLQELGTLTVGQTATFTVPANTASVTIVEQAVSASQSSISANTTSGVLVIDNVAVPLLIKDGTGKVVYDDTVQPPADPSGITTAFFLSDSPATGSFTIPNTSATLTSGVAAGTWTVQVSDFAFECAAQPQACTGGSSTGTYRLSVITKPQAAGGGIPTSGKLDLDFHFATTVTGSASGPPLSAATAGSDPDLARVVSTLGALLAPAGIAIGNVRYHDVPAAVSAPISTGVDVDQTGPCAPLPQLLKNGSTDVNSLNIFLVSRFFTNTNSGTLEVVGVDGTIPGPATIGGTVASGAAVRTANLRVGPCTGGFTLACGDDETAYIIAHEAGHFLGLYHVTEQDGTAFDPLKSTGTCPCSTCKAPSATDACANASPAPAAGKEHKMTVAECTANTTTCTGGDNLMFWVLGNGSLGHLSTEQSQVMLANPLIQ